MQLILPAEVRDQIVGHAFRSIPSEAVGLLGGRQNKVHMALALKNVAREGVFLANAYDQFRAEKAIGSKGMEILAIYHSHPDGCVCLSDLDIAFAKNWQCTHIVISLDTQMRRARIRGYSVSGQLPTEVHLLAIDGKGSPTTMSELRYP